MAGDRHLTGSSGVRLSKLILGGSRPREHISGRRGISSWSTTTAGNLRSARHLLLVDDDSRTSPVEAYAELSC
ncbi:hypothetical protein M6B38_208685 [Iris pallida]|uniref:Uncharacterized protein n=1 Tax=Iris pallida TaxID=29817 RepID=A0AAX6E4Z3_IRIPA|nr:hypothetical protein M6B38_208685 [Iris pallida]